MPNDIVRNMRLSPDYSDLPVPDWSGGQIARGASKVPEFLYDVARAPLTASEDLTRQFQEMRSQPDIVRSMTAQTVPGEATIRQAPPGMGVQAPLEKVARGGMNLMEVANPLAETALAKKLTTGAMAAITGPELTTKLKSFAKNRARMKGTRAIDEYKHVRKLQEWVPQWVWDEAKDLRTGIAETGLGGRYHPATGVQQHFPGRRGGIVELMVDAKNPAGSGTHEAGHLISQVLRNYSRGNPKTIKLANRLKNMDRISNRAKMLENRLRYMESKQKGFTGFMTQAKNQRDLLKQLSLRSYLSSPDELLARNLRKSFEAGESFNMGIRKAMKSSMDEYLNLEAVLDMVENEAQKINPKTFMQFKKDFPKVAGMGGRAVKESKDVVKGAVPRGKLPQLKGALGRETLERELGDILWNKGLPSEVIANVQSSMQHATVNDLKTLIKQYKKGRK